MRLYIEDVTQRLEKMRDQSLVQGMENYMKNKFPFLGIRSTPRRNQMKEWKKSLPADLSRSEAWEIVLELWQKEEREYHHFALDWMMTWSIKSYEKDDIDGI